MLFSLLVFPAAVLALLAVVAAVARRAAGSGPDRDPDTFLLERYRPLGKLLSSEDIVFVADNGLSFSRALAYRFRRFGVTWAYLGALSRDFRRVHRAGRELLVSSAMDLPELSSALMRAQVVFWGASLLAHGEALLMLFGIPLEFGNARTAMESVTRLARAISSVGQAQALLRA